MANPSLLLWDSDALIQILLTNAVAPLKTLKSDYGIQSVVVPEVEVEVLSSKRFCQVASTLKKATGNRLIEVLDEPTYFSLLGSNEALRADAVGTSYSDIQLRGRDYNRRVDTGEAYTFGAALTLHQPAVSHDWNAMKTLMRTKVPVPFCVLRAWDLIVFAHQIGLMSEKDCDRFRKILVQAEEHIPRDQQGKSFRDGLKVFQPRLIDSTQEIVGVRPQQGGSSRFFSPLYVAPRARSASANLRETDR